MRCIKTGCTVLNNGLLYYGDLHLDDGGELVLTGVPRVAEEYSMPAIDQHYHCVSKLIWFLGSDGEYGKFLLSDVVPTDLFRKFLKQWAEFSLPFFKELA